ncbi:MAG TPA: hypothetical protein VHA70_10055 [Bauldia sp.]|nr:hypothetical protein [Bauldia sp.]
MSDTLFKRIEARAAAGERIAFAEIDAAVSADPEAATAFKALADDLRAGREISLADVAKRTGFSEQLLRACELARITGAPLVGLRMIHDRSVH